MFAARGSPRQRSLSCHRARHVRCGERAARGRSADVGQQSLDRPRLTGSWFGLPDDLGKKGIVLDVDLLQIPQGVITGEPTTSRSMVAWRSTSVVAGLRLYARF